MKNPSTSRWRKGEKEWEKVKRSETKPDRVCVISQSAETHRPANAWTSQAEETLVVLRRATTLRGALGPNGEERRKKRELNIKSSIHYKAIFYCYCDYCVAISKGVALHRVHRD